LNGRFVHISTIAEDIYVIWEPSLSYSNLWFDKKNAPLSNESLTSI